MKIVLLCWRDTDHPEGGGSERYLESVAQYLADAGHDVTFRTARYPGAQRSELVQHGGHRPWRISRGGSNLTVYPRAWLWLLRNRWRARRAGQRFADVVVDTQNGVPFFAAEFAGAPTVMLTHHCHREQWSVAGPLLARVGWFIESTLSPWLHRRNRWVTVSRPSADELVDLGVPRGSIEIIRNGVDPVAKTDSWVSGEAGPSEGYLHLVTLSRLVPHKQIEHALDAVAAVRRTHPNIRLDVIGSGWWMDKLRQHAVELGIEREVMFHGHVSESQKHLLLARADLHVMPSRKEGWGLAVIEAAQHGVPTVGYEASAGLRDSVVDGVTGLLAGSEGGFINAVEYLLDNPGRREQMGRAALERVDGFSWAATGQAWELLLCEVAGGPSLSPAGRRRRQH